MAFYDDFPYKVTWTIEKLTFSRCVYGIQFLSGILTGKRLFVLIWSFLLKFVLFAQKWDFLYEIQLAVQCYVVTKAQGCLLSLICLDTQPNTHLTWINNTYSRVLLTSVWQKVINELYCFFIGNDNCYCLCWINVMSD